MQTPRTEFGQALKAIATKRRLDTSVILDTIKQAIVAAYRRDARERDEETEELDFDVELDPISGSAKIFSWPEGKPEEKKDVTPPGFGRIAAQTAKQVIHQKIKEAEKDAIMEEYSGRIGGLISGMILRFDGPNVRVDLGRTEGLMPVDERVPNERLNPNQRLSFLLKEIEDTPKGRRIVLSRSGPEFVKKLFKREVPEINSGSVEIRVIAREAGVRTKIAVASNQPGVDPVGSCVGQKGVRVQAVTNELGGERVDIVPWTDDTTEFIKASLSPAEGLVVALDKDGETANVVAPEDQLSLAIGKDGQNARLASKLTGRKIIIEGDGENVAKGEEPEADEGKVKKKAKKSKKKSVAKKVKKEKIKAEEDAKPKAKDSAEEESKEKSADDEKKDTNQEVKKDSTKKADSSSEEDKDDNA